MATWAGEQSKMLDEKNTQTKSENLADKETLNYAAYRLCELELILWVFSLNTCICLEKMVQCILFEVFYIVSH